MPDNLVGKIYSRDYIAELLSHFDGKSTLAEICEKYSYKLDPLLKVVKGMIDQGLLELISGNDDDIIVKVHRRLFSERSWDLA